MLQRLARFILPRRCPGCGGQVEQAAGLCSACLKQLAPQVQRHSPLSSRAEAHLVVLGPYRGTLGRSVRALKYGGAREVAQALGTRLGEGVPQSWNIQAVTGVPLHEARLRERGFNQAELLGRAAAGGLGVPYLTTLARQRSTGAQARRHARERLTALGDSFVVLPDAALPERLLVVDDVMTTGTTLLACADVLRAGGAAQVWFAVVAR
ncbi:ComF family protein [Deinococcus sp. KNUC1210]|uniref:ComF family protein n=1 Tax=Deinococcus sp. KNUC1210 TaxID=2917691 RepID=UPI001EF06E53|nr:ComF family protein [Deinococcus sp. KNUC1210]ULH16098.1 ComF family protein [Deinococcus sp. KNUC1210]